MPARKSSKNNPAASSKSDEAAHASGAPNGAPRDSSGNASGESASGSAPLQEERDFLEDVERMAMETCEQVLRSAARVSEAAAEATGPIREYAKKHPGGALLVSFLIGAVLGALASRR